MSRTVPRFALQNILFPVWLVLFAVLLFVSATPVRAETQLVLSVGMLVLLTIAYLAGRNSTREVVQLAARFAVILISVLLIVRYLYWRATETMPTQFGTLSMICGLLLFAAELYSIITAFLGFFVNANPRQREAPALPRDAPLPSVDVYIPTYNEDPAIIRATVIAATQMRYPADKLNVYILDDGGTGQKLQDKDSARAAAAAARAGTLKEIAARFGAHYLTRARNEHAKSGNLNSALQHTNGELIAILDCDHVPSTDFVERLVGFFIADPKLFVVQTPHNFVTPDPLERNLRTYHESPAENELFYAVTQPGLDGWGCSFFCGSAAMLRRSVIDEIGGISGQTITEDAETTLDALSLGYRSAYYSRPMVSGLQPETYAGFIVQRVRWAQGMWQIFMLKNPWRQPGLSFVQRVLYTNFAFYWGFAFARLIMLLAPPAYLIFGINLCDTTALGLLSYAAPALIASLIATQHFYGKVRWPFISQVYEVIQSFYLSIGLVAVLRNPRAPSFNVTPKGEILDRHFLSAMAVPFYLFLGLTVIAIALGFQRLATESWSTSAVTFVMFWAFLDLALLLGALGVMYEKRQTRAEPRVVMDLPVEVVRADGRRFRGNCIDVSAHGAGVVLRSANIRRKRFPPDSEIRLEFPTHGVSFRATVRNTLKRDGETLELGLSYMLANESDERAAIQIAYGDSDRLVANNARKHDGRSVLQSLFLLARFGLVQGRDHVLVALWQAMNRAYHYVVPQRR